MDRKADRIKIRLPKPCMPIASTSFAGDQRARRRSPYSVRNRPPFSLADFFPHLFRNVTIFRGVAFSLNNSGDRIAEQQHFCRVSRNQSVPLYAPHPFVVIPECIALTTRRWHEDRSQVRCGFR